MMLRYLFWSSATMLAVLALAATAEEDAAPKRRIPVHTPEWTNPSTSDPGASAHEPTEIRVVPVPPADSVAEDLQKIVVLCGTQPQSEEFKQQWTAYVSTHYEPGMDISDVVDDVLKRAAAYRQRQRSGAGVRRNLSTSQQISTRRMMHDTAKAAIQNVR